MKGAFAMILFIDGLLRCLAAHGRLLPVLLILVGSALPIAAQAPDPPRFLLESVVVEGVQRDPVREIVAAESLLKPGKEYSEQELREAVYRVKRLPFVLDAEFSLRKGSERGTYELVITVEETRLFFYSADIGGSYDGNDYDFPLVREDRVDWGANGTAGGRWFVGPQGLLFGSVQGIDSEGVISGQAGYTHYNLFGRGGFASVVLGTNLGDYFADSEQVSISLGIPIVGNHSLRAYLDWYGTEDEFSSQTFESENRNLQLSWFYDTRDDPIFPTSGTRVIADVRYSEFEQRDEGPFFSNELSGDGYTLGLSGDRHWALTPRQSVSGGLFAWWSEQEIAGDPRTAEEQAGGLTLGHSMDLWGFEKTERVGDLRWETRLQITSFEQDSSFGKRSSTGLSVGTGPVFRNAWGLVRLSFQYFENLEEDFQFRGEVP
jgi:hypothetical protein